MRCRVSILLACFCFAGNSWGQITYIPFAQTLREKGYQIRGEARYWQSQAKYDVNGKKTTFGAGESYKFYEADLSGQYGATDNLQFTMGVSGRRNQANFNNGSGTILSATSTGIQSAMGGLQYSFDKIGNLIYGLEAYYRFTPYTNAAYDTNAKQDIVLGDDGNDYGVGLLFTYASATKNYFNTRLQYRRPGKELSPEIFYQAEVAMAWKYLALLGGLAGVYSLNQDAYTDDPINKPVINTGGSGLYNSINRQYIAPYAGINIALGKRWRIEAKGSVTMNPRSYDSGQLYSIALVRRVEEQQDKKVDEEFKEYDLEATVTKLSPKKGYLVIDKGLSSGLEKGQQFDLFHFDYLGGNTLLGRGVLIQLNADAAVLKIIARYSASFEMKEGTIARTRVK